MTDPDDRLSAHNGSSNGFGLSINIEYDEKTLDVIDILVVNNSAKAVYVEVDGPEGVRGVIGPGVTARLGLRGLLSKVVSVDNHLSMPLPMYSRWPA